MYLFPHVCKVWGMISIRRLYFDKKVFKRQIQSIVMFWKFWLCLLYLCYVLWQKQHQCEKSVRKITQQNVWLDYKFLGKELLPQPIKTERGKWSHHAKLQIFCDEKQEKNTRKYEFAASFGIVFSRIDKSDREDMCAFLLVEMAAIGAISFGQTNKVFKANMAEVKKKPKKPSVMTWHMYVVVKDNFKYPQ